MISNIHNIDEIFSASHLAQNYQEKFLFYETLHFFEEFHSHMIMRKEGFSTDPLRNA